MEKKNLRKEYLSKRKKLSSQFVKIESLKISDIFAQNFNFEAKIKSDGKIIATIPIESIDVVPHTSKLVRVSLESIKPKPNTEYFVEISAKTKNKWGILSAGFEVAHEQIALSRKFKKELTEIENKKSLIIKESSKKLEVSNADVKVVFNKEKGQITSYVFEGNELLKDSKGPKPNFWRAPTDNDFGNQMQAKNIEWKKASIFMKVAKFTSTKNEAGSVNVHITYSLPGVATMFDSHYHILGNGVVKIDNTLHETSYKADLPRVGMRLQLPKKYENMTYFGRGPWENYVDRKASAFIDLYKSKVKDQYVPYVRPQENGYKTDVRWSAFADANNNGLLVVANNQLQGIGISALHIPNEDFDTTSGIAYSGNETLKEEFRTDGIPQINASKHINDIKEQDLVQLNIDLGQRGVAGDNSWGGKPQQKYLMKGQQKHNYSFYLIPFKNGSKKDFIAWSKLYANQK